MFKFEDAKMWDEQYHLFIITYFFIRAQPASDDH